MAGIYIHIPFCSSKCAYCDFYSLANHRSMPAYVDALIAEYGARRVEPGVDKVKTIYIGGGTPSLLPAADFRRLVRVLPLDFVEEFTIEVNPEGVSPDMVEVWREAGVNRVSMGVQSLVDAELKAVGRRHTAQTALDALRILRDGGIGNISCDLIYGLPGQTLSSWMYSLDTLLSAGIEHLSAYCLSYEPGTRLYTQLQRGLINETDEETIEQMYRNLCGRAADAGFEHYEVSNFALPGCRSQHNSAYWTGTPYLGLGPGAHSLDADGIRRMVTSDLKAYIADPTHAVIVDEETEIDRVNDLIMVGLRTSTGLDLDTLPTAYRSAVLRQAEPWLRSGAIIQDGSRLIIPEDHWLVSNGIISDLLVENE